SYWARALKREPFLGQAVASGDIGKTLREGGTAAVPVLSEIVRSPDPDLRMDALLTLSLIGEKAKAAEPMLVEAITNEKHSARFLLAGRTLSNLDPAAATDVLVAVLRDKAESNGGRRAWSLDLLRELAPECQAAVPDLTDIALETATDVRCRVQAVRGFAPLP